MFCFIKVKMPYLCGLWRFANTYFIERAKGGTGILYMGCQMLNEQIAQGSMEGYLDTYTVLPSLTSVRVQDETHFLIHSEILRSLHQRFRLYLIPT